MTGQQCTGSFHSHFFARLAARAACAALALLLCSCTGPGGDGRVEELSLDIEQLQADIDGLRANFQEMQDTMLDIEDMKASVAKLEKWIGQGGSGAAGGADFSADILTLKQQLEAQVDRAGREPPIRRASTSRSGNNEPRPQQPTAHLSMAHDGRGPARVRAAGAAGACRSG